MPVNIVQENSNNSPLNTMEGGSDKSDNNSEHLMNLSNNNLSKNASVNSLTTVTSFLTGNVGIIFGKI